ncbi:MAG: hypothetical protein LBQ40_04570 [Clostridiales bacterium]|jgi:hypothetical protein|nr:hypothetical protein [Clostridiales bacterium]
MESAAAVKGTINGFDKYFSLYDFEKEKDINELSAIIGLFDLDDVPLESSITVEHDSQFLNFGKDANIRLETVKTGKRLFRKSQYHEIKLEFLGSMLESVIKLAAKEGVALYIASVGNDDIEMILNDNDHNYIIYSTSKYNADKIKDKIRDIKKNK